MNAHKLPPTSDGFSPDRDENGQIPAGLDDSFHGDAGKIDATGNPTALFPLNTAEFDSLALFDGVVHKNEHDYRHDFIEGMAKCMQPTAGEGPPGDLEPFDDPYGFDGFDPDHFRGLMDKQHNKN